MILSNKFSADTLLASPQFCVCWMAQRPPVARWHGPGAWPSVGGDEHRRWIDQSALLGADSRVKARTHIRP